MGFWMQLLICYFLSRIPFHLFYRFSKTGNSFSGMEKLLSPSPGILPYLASEHDGISNLAIVLVTEVTEFIKKIFSFERVVKVKLNIHKQLFNTKAVDLWECIRCLFCGIVGDMIRSFHQNNIVVLLPCFHNHWIIATNVYRGVVHTWRDTLMLHKTPYFDIETSMVRKMIFTLNSLDLHISRNLMTTLCWLMSKTLTVTGFIFSSPWLLPTSLAVLKQLVFIWSTTVFFNSGAMVRFRMHEALVFLQTYVFAIFKSGKVLLKNGPKWSAVANGRLCSARKPVT